MIFGFFGNKILILLILTVRMRYYTRLYVQNCDFKLVLLMHAAHPPYVGTVSGMVPSRAKGRASANGLFNHSIYGICCCHGHPLPRFMVSASSVIRLHNLVPFRYIEAQDIGIVGT